jgi:ferritin-like metal-binding protein YciE
MPIKSLQEKFSHELRDIYDAEHQFLQGQEMMLKKTSDSKLKQMITEHIAQTKQQIRNLEEVFDVLGEQPQREMCDGAKGLLSEGQKLLKETEGADKVQDCAIADAASKIEHYEIASYRGLITAADLMGQRGIVSLLQQNLEQEESTAQLIEQSMPELLQKAMTTGDMQQDSYSQASPTY